MEAGETGMLDWLGDAGEVRAESREAMSAYARNVVADIEAGRPLHDLHGSIDRWLDRAELVMGTPRWGTGIELGAGAGYGAAALSRRSGVDRVYVLEHSREFVEHVMPAMFRVTGADCAKLVRVVGGFDRLELPDGSLDFALALAALHHAEDLDAVLRETARVLRPGGFVVVVDRYRPDSTTGREIDVLLDVKLPESLRERYGFEAGRVVTRRDVGEHEIRLAEWLTACRRAGFEPYPFAAVDFGGRLPYRLLGAAWRAVLRRRGDALLRARKWHMLSTHIPFEQRWLMLDSKARAVNLFMVCEKHA